MLLGKEIRTARLNQKLTQKELSKLLGVSVLNVSRWENDRHFPESKNLIRLMQVLKLRLDKKR